MGKYILGIFIALIFCGCARVELHKGDVALQVARHARLHPVHTMTQLTVLFHMQEKASGKPAARPSARDQFGLERILLGLACVLTGGALFIFVWKRWQVLDEPPPPGASPPEKDPPR